METVFQETLASAIGPVRFQYDGDGVLQEIRLPRRTFRPGVLGRRPRGAPAAGQVRAWLDRYLEGRPVEFPGPVRTPGRTAFTRQVYRVVRRIPAGETRSYGEVAALCGSPGAARAVGNAMNRNPLPLIVPCHRVLAADGIGGFGCGVRMKQELLDREAPSALA